MIEEGSSQDKDTTYYTGLERCMAVWGSLTPEKISYFGDVHPNPEWVPKSVTPKACISKETILDVFAVLFAFYENGTSVAVSFEATTTASTLLVATSPPADEKVQNAITETIQCYSDFVLQQGTPPRKVLETIFRYAIKRGLGERFINLEVHSDILKESESETMIPTIPGDTVSGNDLGDSQLEGIGEKSLKNVVTELYSIARSVCPPDDDSEDSITSDTTLLPAMPESFYELCQRAYTQLKDAKKLGLTATRTCFHAATS